jgi:hypothetical protein
MRGEELMRLIDNPALLKKEHVAPLEQLVNEFPYFQPAHLLLSLAAKKWDASVYQRSLKRTAIVATSRQQLYKLIHAESEIQVPEPSPETPKAGTTSPDELNILKAAELSVQDEAPAAIKKQKPLLEESPAVLETEIGRQAVSALVEKDLNKAAAAVTQSEAVPPAASFGEWLSLLKKNNGQDFKRTSERELQTEMPPEENFPATNSGDSQEARRKKMAIIDKIIDTNPGLIRNREEPKFYKPENQAKESLLENEHLVTETLARIYALQGNTGKAIRAYQILSLKNPQKSAYFAALIQQLKNQ